MPVGEVIVVETGPNEEVYPIVKLATVVAALAADGVSPAEALARTQLSASALTSPTARVSLNQIVECYRNAIKLSPDRFFAYRTGLRFHVSTYGMYGFAILSSTTSVKPCSSR